MRQVVRFDYRTVFHGIGSILTVDKLRRLLQVSNETKDDVEFLNRY